MSPEPSTAPILDFRAVFPDNEELIFYIALLYSIVPIINRGVPTIEGCLMLTRTFRLLNEKLTSLLQAFSPAVIGAIMILKAASYKIRDLVAYDTYTL